MPSPLRRPSRSVRVPGSVSPPVRLGHQSTGSFFVPYLERPAAAPATRQGGAPAARPVASAPARRLAAEPSWGTVVATTVRLWAKRRLERPWLRALLMLVLAAVVFVAGIRPLEVRHEEAAR